MLYKIGELKRLVQPIAQKHGVKKVSIFDSYGRGEATSQSDVDICIDKGDMRSLLEIISFQQDVEEALNLPVDVVTSDIRNTEFLDKIRPDEMVLYER